jgi:hypothetical protein
MLEKKYYVYQYLTENGVPYYIGKGSANRIREKHTHTVVPPADRRIIVKDGLTNDEAKALEIELITKYKRKIDGGILDNIKINQWACFDGWNHSEESKKKISQKNKGKVRSKQAKQNYRKPKTSEHAEKIRQANLGRPRDSRYEKISSAKQKQKWYNNGIETRIFEPGKELNGFVLGRKLKV